MSEVSSVSNSAAISSSVISSNSTLGKEQFLELLVAQLRHQDPLSPMESQDLAVQLAQFSEVEILNNIEDTLEYNGELDVLLSQAVSNTLAASFVGKNVTSIGDSIQLINGEETELYFKLADYAKDVTVRITDSDGNVVRTIETNELIAGSQSVVWDGKDDDGNDLTDGTYSFSIEASDADGLSVTATTYLKGFVTAVRYINGSAILMVNGKEIALSDVLEIG